MNTFPFLISLRACAFLACSVGLPLAAGCRLHHVGDWSVGSETSEFSPASETQNRALAGLEKLLATTQETRRADGTTFSEPTEGWFQVAAPPDNAVEYRWQHAGLNRWLSLAEPRRPSLTTALKSTKPGVAAAARIGLARQIGRAHADAVAELAADPTLALATRRAAIETLARVEEDAAQKRFDRLFAELTAGNAKQAANYQPLLHVELLQGLVARGRRSDDPRMTTALVAESVEVRVAALELLAASGASNLPRPALALLSDSDPKVRAAALGAAAACQDPKALPEALRAARDADAKIRLAGIAALGAIGGRQAAGELREIAGREGELFQAAAVTALGELGDWPAVRQAIEDKSWRVRRSAAAALAPDTSPEGAAALRRLLADSSTEVQLRAVESISARPLAAAGPLLLLGLESRHYATRAAARAALAKMWAPAAEISPEELRQLTPPRQTLEALQSAWAAEFADGGLAFTPLAVPRDKTEPGAPTSNDRDNSSHTTNATTDVALLTRRLGHGNKLERLAAAAELARQGYESGSRGLEALAFDLDPEEIRRRAAGAIGSLEDPLLLASLVRLLDDEPPVRLAALKAMRQIVGRDIAAEERPRANNAEEEAERWKAWYRRGGS